MVGRVEQFWSEFVAATGINGPYAAWAFGGTGGENPEFVTELALLVRDGPKRATAGLYASYEEESEKLPQPGDLSVILDADGDPVCVIRTTEVDVRRFGDVDEQFAWDEGEGDRSLAFWRRVHEAFFRAEGADVDDDTLVVLERFELLWAPAG